MCFWFTVFSFHDGEIFFVLLFHTEFPFLCSLGVFLVHFLCSANGCVPVFCSIVRWMRGIYIHMFIISNLHTICIKFVLHVSSTSPYCTGICIRVLISFIFRERDGMD